LNIDDSVCRNNAQPTRQSFVLGVEGIGIKKAIRG
jgi:hypothetical protein